MSITNSCWGKVFIQFMKRQFTSKALSLHKTKSTFNNYELLQLYSIPVRIISIRPVCLNWIYTKNIGLTGLPSVFLFLLQDKTQRKHTEATTLLWRHHRAPHLLFIHRHSLLAVLGLLDNESPSLLSVQCVGVSGSPPSPAVVERFRSNEPSSNPNIMDTGGDTSEEATGSSMSAAQRRAEMRRRKLLLNSEDRLNRIVGFAKNGSDNNGTKAQPNRCRAQRVDIIMSRGFYQNTIISFVVSVHMVLCAFLQTRLQ